MIAPVSVDLAEVLGRVTELIASDADQAGITHEYQTPGLFDAFHRLGGRHRVGTLIGLIPLALLGVPVFGLTVLASRFLTTAERSRGGRDPRHRRREAGLAGGDDQASVLEGALRDLKLSQTWRTGPVKESVRGFVVDVATGLLTEVKVA